MPRITKTEPIKYAPIFFTDANKECKAGYYGPTTKIWQSSYSSIKQAELDAIITVLSDIIVPINIISDSQYVVKVTFQIETIHIPVLDPPIHQLFLKLQDIVGNRQFPFHITHIRSHSQLPGPLSEGDDQIDVKLTTLLTPTQFHDLTYINVRDFSYPDNKLNILFLNALHVRLPQ